MDTTVSSIVLLSLRMGPLLILAPPFSLIRAPQRVRIAMLLTLAAVLAPVLPMALPTDRSAFVVSALSELLLGLTLALALQLAFASLSFAGRVLDIQAGYGLALVIDPGSRAQSPLLGTVLVMTAAVFFFATDGHLELLRVVAATAQTVPVGRPAWIGESQTLIDYAGLVMGLGLGAIAAGMMVLFLTDAAIALLSRALPQMNALVLGFQIKTMLTLLMLAASAGLLAPVVLRLIRHALQFMVTVVEP